MSIELCFDAVLRAEIIEVAVERIQKTERLPRVIALRIAAAVIEAEDECLGGTRIYWPSKFSKGAGSAIGEKMELLIYEMLREGKQLRKIAEGCEVSLATVMRARNRISEHFVSQRQMEVESRQIGLFEMPPSFAKAAHE